MTFLINWCRNLVLEFKIRTLLEGVTILGLLRREECAHIYGNSLASKSTEKGKLTILSQEQDNWKWKAYHLKSRARQLKRESLPS